MSPEGVQLDYPSFRDIPQPRNRFFGAVGADGGQRAKPVGP